MNIEVVGGILALALVFGPLIAFMVATCGARVTLVIWAICLTSVGIIMLGTYLLAAGLGWHGS